MSEQTNRTTGFPSDLLIDIRSGDGRNLRERLEAGLRGAIQSGRLATGSPLPPTRVLAAELAISRSVVAEAYGNLKADGYLMARVGVGTRVSAAARHHWPDEAGAIPRERFRQADFELAWLARPGFQPPRRPRPAEGSPSIRLFGGLPDPALFPRTSWSRHYRAALAEVPDPEFTYPNLLGAPDLRRALAAYVGRVRGVATDPTRMVICSGFTQGLVMVCRAFRRSGATRIAVEDPCFAHHRVAISMAGLEPAPVPVDRDGLDPAGLPSDVAAVLVAPAHSYPSGGTLDADRRRALISWARTTGAIVIEDDYDAEFRYDRQPIGSLQGLAPEHVVYIGCASKTVTPAIRLGWLAAPGDLIDVLEREKLYDDMGSTLLDQLAFARFVDCGDFARHLRRVRPVYRGRRDATIKALEQHLPDARWQGAAAGLHLHVFLPNGVDELELAAASYERGVLVEDGAWHWARPGEAPPSIVLGYGSVTEPAIKRGIAILGQAMGACR